MIPIINSGRGGDLIPNNKVTVSAALRQPCNKLHGSMAFRKPCNKLHGSMAFRLVSFGHDSGAPPALPRPKDAPAKPRSEAL